MVDGVRVADREEVRRIVAEESEAANGDKKLARRRIRERLKARFEGKPGINPIIMSLLLQLAMAIFMEWWNSRNQTDQITYEDVDDDSDFDGFLESTELC